MAILDFLAGGVIADEISFRIRNSIVQKCARMIAEATIPALDMAANADKPDPIRAKPITPAIAGHGLELPESYIENISLPAGGADLGFRSGEGRLFRNHCNHTEPLSLRRPSRGAISETAFRRWIKDQLPATKTGERHLSDCHNRGVDVQFDPSAPSPGCRSCATPVIADPVLTRHRRPKRGGALGSAQPCAQGAPGRKASICPAGPSMPTGARPAAGDAARPVTGRNSAGGAGQE